MVSRNILADRGHLERVQLGVFPFSAYIFIIQFLIRIKDYTRDPVLQLVKQFARVSLTFGFWEWWCCICCNVEQIFYFTSCVFFSCEIIVSSSCSSVLYSAPTMDQISTKTPNPKCRLYWSLIEFIDWRYGQSCWYFRPPLVNKRPSNLLTGSPTPLPPPFMCE